MSKKAFNFSTIAAIFSKKTFVLQFQKIQEMLSKKNAVSTDKRKKSYAIPCNLSTLGLL
jgi:hypothetical protein